MPLLCLIYQSRETQSLSGILIYQKVELVCAFIFLFCRVWLKLVDESACQTSDLRLSRFWHNDHERGQVDSFSLLSSDIPDNFGELQKLEVWRDSFGLGDSW
jgi:hypothetical protein